MIEKIEKKEREKMTHLKAIYFIRPTMSNMNYLEEELKEPRYILYDYSRFGEYYIYLTNSLPDE